MADWIPIEGQHALITGAAVRLGAAVARRLARAGMDITLHYRYSRTEAERLAGEIRDLGRQVWLIAGDLSDPEVARNLITQTSDQARPVDALINNASIFEDASLQDLNEENLWRNVRTNALGPFLLARAFADQQRKGCIVNFLDAMVADFDATHVPYHISKRMLSDLTSMMAVSFAPDVRVNAVAPGLVLAPVGKDEQYLEERHHTNPLRAHGGEEGIAEAVHFLLRSGFITGQTIYVDGGRHLQGKMYA